MYLQFESHLKDWNVVFLTKNIHTEITSHVRSIVFPSGIYLSADSFWLVSAELSGSLSGIPNSFHSSTLRDLNHAYTTNKVIIEKKVRHFLSTHLMLPSLTLVWTKNENLIDRFKTCWTCFEHSVKR